MPDKNYKPGCGKTCVRCWRNKLKHGSKQAKAYLTKNPADSPIWTVEAPEGEKTTIKAVEKSRQVVNNTGSRGDRGICLVTGKAEADE
jgi:hypothetical protein